MYNWIWEQNLEIIIQERKHKQRAVLDIWRGTLFQETRLIKPQGNLKNKQRAVLDIWRGTLFQETRLIKPQGNLKNGTTKR